MTSRSSNATRREMTEIIAGVVDVYVIRPLEGWLEGPRGSACHRHPLSRRVGDHSRPARAGRAPGRRAVREVREETGLEVDRLYNVTVQPFYLHMFGACSWRSSSPPSSTSRPKSSSAPSTRLTSGCSPHELRRGSSGRASARLSHISHLLAGGDAGPVEDVLRVICNPAVATVAPITDLVTVLRAPAAR